MQKFIVQINACTPESDQNLARGNNIVVKFLIGVFFLAHFALKKTKNLWEASSKVSQYWKFVQNNERTYVLLYVVYSSTG